MTALIPIPFLSGGVTLRSVAVMANKQPEGKLERVIPLSVVQQALLLDYLRRPHASHYLLTLRINLETLSPSLDHILRAIQVLGQQHDMLRSTFHLDPSSNSIDRSFMAVHDREKRLQEFHLVQDEERLYAVLRHSFDLTSQFPVRWIVRAKIHFEEGQPVTSYDLYVVAHHIAVDGKSMSFLSESILQQFQTQEDTSIHVNTGPKLPDYGRFVQEQDAFLRSPAGAAAKDFWLSQLTRTIPFDWITEKPKVGQKDRSIKTWTTFSNEELAAWGNTYKTSWFRIALSIISLITAANSKPTPHDDHVLLVAFSGRPLDYEKCVSHMANTMPIKVPLSSLLKKREKATFEELVRHVGRNMSSAKKHEMFPFVRLLDEAQKASIGADLDFKVAVTFSPKLADNRCTLFPVEGVWDLFFCFIEQQNGVSLGVISDPNVFGTQALNAMRAQFNDLIQLAKEMPQFRIDRLPLLAGRSISSIMDGPDTSDIDMINRARVHDWIEARCIAQPNAVALFSGERKLQMTYAELNQKTHQIASHIRSQGHSPGGIVAVHIARGFKMVLWILGILKAGFCFVIIDKDLPMKRKQANLRVCEATMLVTDSPDETEVLALVASFPTILRLDSILEEELASIAGVNTPRTDMAGDDLAYMVFTSGSTGQPKAIMVEHQNLSNYVSAARTVVEIGPGSRVLQFASFAFDASILEWAVTLAFGATLCFVDHPKFLVGEYLLNILELNRINFFHTTPSVLATISAEQCPKDLRFISVGGEPSSAGLLGAWRKRVCLLHAYGPTETTVIVTTHIISHDATEGLALPSPSLIGKAFPNCDVVIFGEDATTPLPAGEVGEICIIGAQVSQGYRGQPELTAAKFTSIEHKGRTQRLYRTGDRGWLTIDGELMIKGRMQNREIKLRGYRMDLYEIEKSILDHNETVLTASVQVVQDSLAAFVTPDSVDCNQVRENLMADIPSYCIPKTIIAVKELPLNANGKIDHNAVLAESQSRGAASMSHAPSHSFQDGRSNHIRTTAPRKQIDPKVFLQTLTQVITRIWMDVLSSANTPAEEVNFFDAGGHSILLIELHKKLASTYPTANLRLVDVFQHTTIKSQAAMLAMRLSDGLSQVASASFPERDRIFDSAISNSQSENGCIGNTDGKFAIVGLAGRFPGADNVNEFWETLVNGQDGITTFKHDQQSTETEDMKLGPDEIFVPRFGTVSGLDDFVPQIWGLTREDADAMDPQKRLFLLVTSEAFKDAGIELSRSSTNNIGVFVGAAANSYQHAPRTPAPVSDFTRRYRTLLDENISTFTAYKFNLTGPNVTLNTACASSLVAFHFGLNSLHRGECDTALIGGTSVVYPQEGGYVTCRGQVFAASGQCRPFDARSDGSVPADAVAAILVKRLDAAIRDNNPIYAVVEGHAIGTDGATDKVGFVVPSSTGQARTIVDAIKSSNISANNIKYVETHGSATPMGDALELAGLEKAFDEVGHSVTSFTNSSSNPVYIGSNKGNFGNTETASGLLSLIKTSLALARGVMPPLRELETTNPDCDFRGRFRPLTQAMELGDGDFVGITSLGYGGTNAHVILGRAPPGLRKQN